MNRIKPYRTGLLWLGLALLSLTTDARAESSTGLTVGEAFDLETNELLYRETHCVSADNDSREVIYKNRSGRLIARKLLDFRSGAITPSFVQHNLYSSEVIEVVLDQGKLTMSVLDADNRKPKSTKSTRPGDELPVVIDAGFDEFVRAHWDSLVGGDTRQFLFPFAARESLIELRMRPLTCTYDTDNDQCFRLEMSNWLYRVLAPPIELGYDPETRRLTRFRGLSNIGDENGNGLVVDIRYRYGDLPQGICVDATQRLTDNSDLLDLNALLYGEGT